MGKKKRPRIKGRSAETLIIDDPMMSVPFVASDDLVAWWRKDRRVTPPTPPAGHAYGGTDPFGNEVFVPTVAADPGPRIPSASGGVVGGRRRLDLYPIPDEFKRTPVASRGTVEGMEIIIRKHPDAPDSETSFRSERRDQANIGWSIKTGVDDVEIRKAFNGPTFVTPDGEMLGVCMRDSGFEITYLAPGARPKDIRCNDGSVEVVEHAESVEQEIGELVGEASTCWDNLSGAGTFRPDRASQITSKILAIIEREKAASIDGFWERHAVKPDDPGHPYFEQETTEANVISDDVDPEEAAAVKRLDRLAGTNDAMEWAEAWCATARKILNDIDPGKTSVLIDAGWMVGWFANAMAAQEAQCCGGRANLGRATTKELVEEIEARLELGTMHPDYRPVDD